MPLRVKEIRITKCRMSDKCIFQMKNSSVRKFTEIQTKFGLCCKTQKWSFYLDY